MEIGKQRLIRNLIMGTCLSILIFFSISFLFVLYRISPITMGNTYQLKIGFPLNYYEQFQVSGSDFLNSSWKVGNLIIDCFLTWIITIGIYVKIKNKN